MKPYYEHAGVTIYHGDQREVLPTLAGVSFPLVLTDPPYDEVTHAGARTTRPGVKLTTVPVIDFASTTAAKLLDDFKGIARLASGRVVSFMDWRHIGAFESSPPAGLRFVRFGIWDKSNGAPQFTGDRPSTGWEAIAILHRLGGKMVWNGGGQRAVWRCNKENGVHPAQKPLDLILRLVDLFSNPGDAVLDPWMGSGTTLRSCKDLGRSAVGIESEERYCEIAARRMEQAVLPFMETAPEMSQELMPYEGMTE